MLLILISILYTLKLLQIHIQILALKFQQRHITNNNILIYLLAKEKREQNASSHQAEVAPRYSLCFLTTGIYSQCKIKQDHVTSNQSQMNSYTNQASDYLWIINKKHKVSYASLTQLDQSRFHLARYFNWYTNDLQRHIFNSCSYMSSGVLGTCNEVLHKIQN